VVHLGRRATLPPVRVFISFFDSFFIIVIVVFDAVVANCMIVGYLKATNLADGSVVL